MICTRHIAITDDEREAAFFARFRPKAYGTFAEHALTTTLHTLLEDGYVVVDLECTGLPRHDYFEIWELGAVKVKPGKSPLTYRRTINPGNALSDEIKALCQVSRALEATINASPTKADVLPKFLRWTEGLPIVAHRAFEFDWLLLRRDAEQLGLDFNNLPFCTIRMSKLLLDRAVVGGFALQSLLEHFGIAPGSAHRALDDAVATHALLENYRHVPELAERFAALTLNDMLNVTGY